MKNWKKDSQFAHAQNTTKFKGEKEKPHEHFHENFRICRMKILKNELKYLEKLELF
jgi:hypothetical protein